MTQNDLHLLYTQFCVSKRTFCLSDNFIISPYMVSEFHGSLQDYFSCQRYLPADRVRQVTPPELFKGREVWLPPMLGLWTKIRTRYERVTFVRQRSECAGS